MWVPNAVRDIRTPRNRRVNVSILNLRVSVLFLAILYDDSGMLGDPLDDDFHASVVSPQ